MKKRITKNSTTAETYNDFPKIPVPFKEPSGELRENVEGNDFISWFKRLIDAFRQK